MSVTNFAGQVLLRYKADTSDAKSKVKDLQGVQRDHAKAHLQSLEDQNKGIEKHIATIGKIGIGIGVATVAVGVAQKAWASYQEDTKLRLNAHGHDINRLREASGGLKTDLQLLTLAAADNNGAWDLNQEQLETVVKAMRSFEKQGRDSEKVMNAMEKALTEGSVEPLKEFGIVIEGVAGKEEKFRAFMQAMGDQTKKFAGDLSTAKDGALQSLTEIENGWRDLKVAIGEIVSELEPMMAWLGRGASSVARNMQGDYSSPEERRGVSFDVISSSRLQLATERSNKRSHDFAMSPQGMALAGFDMAKTGRLIVGAAVKSLSNGMNGAAESVKALASSKKKKKGGGSKGEKAFLGRIEDESDLEFDLYQYKAQEIADILGDGLGIGGVGASDAFKNMQEEQSRGSRYAAFQKGQTSEQSGHLAGIFGPIEDFNMYSEAFTMVSGAAQSAFDAWVSGSATAGEAMKAFFKQSIMGLASDMAAKSLRHAAEAIGSLAYGNFAQAAMHGKSAAMFAAGAVAIGSIARSMGGGGASVATPMGGGTGGGAGVRSPGFDRQQNSNATIVIGDDFADDSPRQRQRKLARSIEIANRNVGERTVRFT